MSFIAYDLTFLVLFTLVAVLFLGKRRKNLKRQGWIFLYHTKVGLNLMDNWAKKYARVLKPMQYVVIASGYVLLVGMSWLLIKTAYQQFGADLKTTS